MSHVAAHYEHHNLEQSSMRSWCGYNACVSCYWILETELPLLYEFHVVASEDVGRHVFTNDIGRPQTELMRRGRLPKAMSVSNSHIRTK